MDAIDPALLALCETTPLVDTHEHLVEERRRVDGDLNPRLFPCDDWTYLLHHYFPDDLAGAGMTPDQRRRLFDPETTLDAKADLFLPYWELAKFTGYGQAVRRSIQALYGEDDITRESLPRIADAYRALVAPGFYRKVLGETAGLVHCQVNSLERIFYPTDLPDLLPQDLSVLALTNANEAEVAAEFGPAEPGLDGWLAKIDEVFAACGPKAIAVKSQIAYQRRLNFEEVTRERAEVAWTRRAPEDQKPLQDFLMRHCVRRAVEYGLPVKLHTGYYAGHGWMPLERVRHNPADLVSLIQAFPDAKFVLMHIGWPYQDEILALAKHFPNVWVDLCWAWIINPAAGVRFVREFLLTATANKLLVFGGDYMMAECVVGHGQIARRGVAEALTGLVAGGWLRADEASSLVATLFWRNQYALFPHLPGAWGDIPVLSAG